MEIVIDIHEEEYALCKRQWDTECLDTLMIAVKNGTPLPKGHDRLIDSKALGDYFWEHRSRLFTHKDLQSIIDHAPTILEADKESE